MEQNSRLCSERSDLDEHTNGTLHEAPDITNGHATNHNRHASQKPKKIFIVEHLDPELDMWQAIEYQTIAHECNDSGCDFLLTGVREDLDIPDWYRLEMVGKMSTLGVETIYPTADARSRVCLLDPRAEVELAPDHASFDAFLFGGILGDDPPRDRTGELRNLGFPGRRLGPKQMTTDTAARVVRMIVVDGERLEDIPYNDEPTLEVGKNEFVEMPFRYVADQDGKPVLPKGMLDLLAKDADKGILDLL